MLLPISFMVLSAVLLNMLKIDSVFYNLLKYIVWYLIGLLGTLFIYDVSFRVEALKEAHIRAYIVELQKRGKYTLCADDRSHVANHPTHRKDYQQTISNTTINNYLICQRLVVKI